MKVGIIGGGGIVGSSAGFALQLGGIVHEIVLVDMNADLADGQALDMLHGTASIADQVIRAGGYADLADADVICITAGLRRKPDESRLALINRNVELFRSILATIQQAGHKSDCIVLVVSNPVDILTYLAEKELKLPKGRVIGLGTLLDTLRFRSLLAMNLGAPATQVQAMILGEHGDSMVPVWSSASIAGLPLEKWPGYTPKLGADVFQRAKTSGAEMIKKKTGAGFAVGVSIAEVIHAIALDSRCRRCLPEAARRQPTGSATWRSRCRRRLAGPAQKRSSRSRSGRRNSRRCSVRPASSATPSRRSSAARPPDVSG